MALGRVKWFNEIKGTGVIQKLGGGQFTVHFEDIAGAGFRTLFEGEAVEFEISSGEKGLEATRVKRISRDPENNSHV